MFARKRFGQHFLTDQMILHEIIHSLALQKHDHVLEIGPGRGALTQHLLDSVDSLEVIEIDRDLILFLKNHFASYPKLKIHQGDVLKFDWKNIANQLDKIRVIGNLPYNISTPLLFVLFSQLELFQDMHFLLQKEVVDRLTAEVGSSHYGRLSVMSQYFCESMNLFTVPPSAFEPPPKVTSAFIRMIPRPLKIPASDFNQFSNVVREAFSYRRKTLGNALKRMVPESQLTALALDPKVRPQELAVEDYVKISNSLLQ